MTPFHGATLSLSRISHRFSPKTEVLHSINLEIPAGQFISLLGPSGCGKSTLLRIIANLIQPTQGEIKISLTASELSQSLVFQDATLMPWRTVMGNVLFPLELKNWEKKKAVNRAKEELERVGLVDFLNHYPGQLSGGMKMRVSVARALVTRPQLLLLDEPFSALDENTRHLLQEELRKIFESLKMTVVFVTHSASEAVFLSERIIRFSSRPATLLAEYDISLPKIRTQILRDDPHYLALLKSVRSR